MEEVSVTFKGSVNGLTIIMKEEDSFETILQQIDEKVDSAGNFFTGAVLHVRYRGKHLSLDEEKMLYEVLSSKSGAKIKSVGPEEDTNAVTGEINSKSLKQKIKSRSFSFQGLEQGNTKFFRGTVRSGKLLDFDGNIVVIGDVNPGGEIVATGNVVVMGSLRGIVHAGADGNKDAIIVALHLAPTQLRIADIITRAPDEGTEKGVFIPELAFIKEDSVYIERYLPQR